MSEVRAEGAGRPVEGRMFLYQQPELLTRADHGGLGLSVVKRPYDFVRRIRAAPLVSLEFSSAQKDYPVVFSDTDIPLPLAVLGVVDDVNLFVDDTGNWERLHYIPSYIRCHPISFATEVNDQLAVVIDRAAASVSEHPDEPFFDGDRLTERMQRRVEFCAAYNLERQKTKAFCARVKQLDLFRGQQITHQARGRGENQPVGTYLAIDVEKLGALDTETIGDLHADGSLSAIYAHVFSLENWSRLLDRRVARRLAAGEMVKEG
ncbi:MAG: SapC family protein [Woeseiaceae bacterium]